MTKLLIFNVIKCQYQFGLCVLVYQKNDGILFEHPEKNRIPHPIPVSYTVIASEPKFSHHFRLLIRIFFCHFEKFQ